MHQPNDLPAPRYRRRPDLDQVAAWEHLTDGGIRFTAPGYDLNSAEALAADAFMALPLAERAAQTEALAAARSAHTPPAPPTDDADMWRDELERTDLGGGLARLLTMWRYREAPGAEVADLGAAIVYELRPAAGAEPVEVEIEIDPDARFVHRRVHILWYSGAYTADISNTAAQLGELAALLARPEVREALSTWAAEDAAVDAAERTALSAQEGGQQ
jgi:hypothetical protein